MSESLPYDDIEKVMKILQMTFTGDGSKIKEATTTISTMCTMNQTRFTDTIAKIVTIEKQDGKL